MNEWKYLSISLLISYLNDFWQTFCRDRIWTTTKFASSQVKFLIILFCYSYRTIKPGKLKIRKLIRTHSKFSSTTVVGSYNDSYIIICCHLPIISLSIRNLLTHIKFFITFSYSTFFDSNDKTFAKFIPLKWNHILSNIHLKRICVYTSNFPTFPILYTSAISLHFCL